MKEMPIINYTELVKQYPNCPKTIPMAMLNEVWARHNHGQTLARLAERGGLGPCEAVAIFEQRRHEKMSQAIAIAILNAFAPKFPTTSMD